MERLQLLIFSQDSSLVGLVRAALQDLGIAGCHCDNESTRALEVLRIRHFDGIILDCNDLACAQEILTRIRRGSSNWQTPVIAVLNDATDMRRMQAAASRKAGGVYVRAEPLRAPLPRQRLACIRLLHPRHLLRRALVVSTSKTHEYWCWRNHTTIYSGVENEMWFYISSVIGKSFVTIIPGFRSLNHEETRQ